MTAVTLRLGLIGCGRIAQAAHLPAIEKTEDVELAIVMDRNASIASRVAAQFGVSVHSTKEGDVFGSDVDAVLIAVPDRWHAELTQAALAAGKHVLVEKPVAATVEEADAVVRSAADSELIVQVASVKRHDPGVGFAANAVKSDVGPVTSFTAWYRVPFVRTVEALFPHMIDDPGVRQAANAAKDADRAGYVLATHGAHVFDSIRFVAGDVEWIDARHVQRGSDHVWQGQLGLCGQGIGTFQIAAAAHGEWEEGMDVLGERGSVQLRTHVPFARRSSNVRVYRDETQQWQEPFFGESDAFKNQVEAFTASVAGQRAASPTAYDGLQAVRLIAAAAQSAAENRSISL